MNRSILKGLIDLHVHTGPSTANRELDVADMLTEARAAGYRGFLVKDHYFPSALGCTMIEKHLAKGDVRIFSSLALNHSMGLFNLKAVDTARQMGTQMIYFPTVSAKNHIDAHKGNFAGSGMASVKEEPVVYVDEDGVMMPEAVEILKYMAANDMVLGTGHGSAWEIDHLVTKAFEVGVKRVLVNHPHFHIGATYEQMQKWAKMGAYIELNVCVFSDASKLGPLPWHIVDEMLEALPIDCFILDSDMGQKGNGSPVEGMMTFINLLESRNGLTEADIELIGKTNPAKLMRF
ncbi:hypothetical protein KHM83_07160 [Fusibacter paucivorans]|uniref:Polymerase/histidinol phosphatase N-terminal domain-containing protein n=1 Tax=Fusibacter paucivorans TaxID=76009 RepID=A0ABS5PNF5_9FIRM|nr:DUF6282 family protein [Fusibacter paucivorans]MBS7526452.1 hypothetical protein [Fusibacter paucivorans]